MKFLELHHPTKDIPIVIVVNNIVFITPNNENPIKYTCIGTVDGKIIEVKENYEEIMRWLLTT